jgi:hypothetical protein
MPARRLWPFLGLLLLSGCLWPVRENADHSVCDLAAHHFDLAPVLPPDSPAPKDADKKKDADKESNKEGDKKPDKKTPGSPTDSETTALLQKENEPQKKDRASAPDWT